MSTIPLKELKNARALIIRILKSRRYNASNRIADALPPLVRDKQLLHCIMKPPIFENLVCEERRPFLMQYLDELNLRVFDFVRLLRRSIESYYNVGYMRKDGKDDNVYNYHLAARPKPVGSLNVTVAEYRRCVSRQLIGIITLLYDDCAFYAAESAARCCILLNLGVRDFMDIPKGNLVELESCKSGIWFLSKCHAMLDINYHIKEAKSKNLVILHEKNMRKKVKQLKRLISQLEQKNVPTAAAILEVKHIQERQLFLRRHRRRRRRHSATRHTVRKVPMVKKRMIDRKEILCTKESRDILQSPYI